MKKEYTNPVIKTIELDQLDVITTSEGNLHDLDGGKVNKNDTLWSGIF